MCMIGKDYFRIFFRLINSERDFDPNETAYVNWTTYAISLNVKFMIYFVPWKIEYFMKQNILIFL